MRSVRYDSLRAVSAFLVIGTHCAANDMLANLDHPNFGFAVSAFFSAFTRMAVPLFVMLSGAFVLADIRNKEFGYFYRKSFHKVLIPTLGWSIGYVLCKYLFLAILSFQGGYVNWTGPLRSAMIGQPYYHLWYLYMVIGLYAVVPFILRIKERVGTLAFLGLGIIFSCLSLPLEHLVTPYWPLQWVIYLGFFILGFSIRNELEHPALPKWISSCFKLHYLWYAAISVTVTGLAIYLVIQGVFSGQRLEALWYFKNQSPTTQIGAIACFLAFANWNPAKLSGPLTNLIARIAAQSFFIYLIHAGILHFVLDGLNRIGWHPAPLLFIPLGTMLIFVLSFYLGEGLDRYKGITKKAS